MSHLGGLIVLTVGLIDHGKYEQLQCLHTAGTTCLTGSYSLELLVEQE